MLDIALQKAWESQSLALPNPSVGAVVVAQNGEILAVEAHTKAGEAHAELKASKEAFKKLTQCQVDLDCLTPAELFDFLCIHHNGVFEKCKFYVTLEPCNHYGKTPPCSSLLATLKPQKVIFGVQDNGLDSKGGARQIQQAGVEVIGGVRLKECCNLIYPFLTLKNKGRFNLFKLAQRLDGSYQNGMISNPSSQKITHSQRGVIDKLVLSGKTICNDRPKLDTRKAMSAYKRENIAIRILTRRQMDLKDCKSIHSSDIKICHHINELELESGFNVIEGGYALLESLKEWVDCMLVILSPQIGGKLSTHKLDQSFSLLHSHCIAEGQNKDMWLWLKP